MEETKKECKCNGNCKCKKSVQEMAPDMEKWLYALETKDQPIACSIDNPDCENCGS